MDKRNFFALQNVQPSEMTALVAAIDQAVGQAGYETNMRGIVYGLGVGPTDPVTLAARVQPGVALFCPSTPPAGATRRVQVCRMLDAASISLAADYLGAGTAVTAGLERWVSIVIRPKNAESDPRTDWEGNTVNFIVTESSELIVVSGTAAAAGTAVRPAVGALGIRLADCLLAYGTSTITSVDTGGREDVVTSLKEGAESNAKGYSLFWESQRNTGAVGAFRAYLSNGDVGPAGVVFTMNAAWNVDAQKWYGASSISPCMALRFGENGFMVTVRTEGLEGGWVDAADGSWNDVTSPGGTDSVLISKDGIKVFGKAKAAELGSTGVVGASGGAAGVDESSVTVPISIMGHSGPSYGLGLIPQMSCCVPFPRPFAVAPTRVFVDDTDYGVGGGAVGTGPTYDRNVTPDVSHVAFLLTRWGVVCIVTPTAQNVLTWYNRVITVMQ